ncbi:PilZ domain-containing protein [Shewanella benthica]|nr:PilZ domain-containing protein [Shewanella benthica]
MDFSTDEVNFFKQLFSERPSEVNLHTITVRTQIPSDLAAILSQSSLTLLAQGEGYKLWIPLHLELDEFGGFKPNLGTPEVIDINGCDRSRRVNTPIDVTLWDQADKLPVDILSLSLTGLTVSMQGVSYTRENLFGKVLNLRLPNQPRVELELEPVRVDSHIFAIKFKCLGHGQESIRKFLFNLHRSRNADLYRSIGLAP